MWWLLYSHQSEKGRHKARPPAKGNTELLKLERLKPFSTSKQAIQDSADLII